MFLFKIGTSIYGTGQGLIRVPINAISGKFYRGPNFAFFAGSQHTATHLSSVIAGLVVSVLLDTYGVNHLF